MSEQLRSCWQNCYVPDEDNEVLVIDALEDSIAPLDDTAIKIRGLITRFESCYHEVDKEAEMIIRAIGSGEIPVESNERPAQRKRELQNSYDILSAWCEGDLAKYSGLDVGGISADELVGYLGEPNDLKIWQVQRLIEKLKEALDKSFYYHNMKLSIDGYGQPIKIKGEEYYKDHLGFLKQTVAAKINYTLDGKKSEMSVALAIDLLRPCNWNFVGNLIIILRAINGELKPDGIFAPCSLNAKLTPLRGRLRIISNTLKTFCESEEKGKDVDGDLLALLGAKTEVKQWLAASLGKTIRLHQDF